MPGMVDERTAYRGKWWLPTNVQDEQWGRLVVGPDGDCELQLDGAFPTRRYDPVPGQPARHNIVKIEAYPVIHGQAGNVAYTLFGTRTRSVKDALIGDAREHNIHVQRAISGPFWVDAEDEVVFNGAIVEIDYLLDWSGKSSLSSAIGSEGGGFTAGRSEHVEPITATAGGLSLTLRLHRRGFNERMENPNTRLLSGSETATLAIETVRRHNFKYFDQATKAIQDLLTICFDHGCAVRDEQMSAPVPPFVDPEGRSHPTPTWNTNVYGRHILVPDILPYTDLKDRALFTLEDIPFEQVIRRWYKLYKKARIPIQMLAGLQYISEGYTGNRLMSACAAIESLHRELYDHLLMPRDEHKALVRQAKAGVAAEHKQIIGDRLQNTISYYTRAIELTDKLGPEVTKKLLGDRVIWARLARDGRNSLAHATGTAPMSPEVQFRLMVVTCAVAHLVIGKRLGMTKAQQLAYITRNGFVSFNSLEFRRLTDQIPTTEPVLGVRTRVVADDA
jgi:hypothetical protein